MPLPLLIDQPSLQGFCPIADAVHVLASQADADERGAVNTRPEVVAFMLDLAGYTACQPLHRSTFHATRQKIDALLLAHGLADAEQARLLSAGHIAAAAVAASA